MQQFRAGFETELAAAAIGAAGAALQIVLPSPAMEAGLSHSVWTIEDMDQTD